MFLLACGWSNALFCGQAFEGLDREGKGFLTAEGIKQVVGLDFDADEVSPPSCRIASSCCIAAERYQVCSSGEGVYTSVRREMIFS